MVAADGHRLAAEQIHRVESLQYHAIRVNDQCRVVFRFEGHDAHDVRCTDYH